MGKKEQKSGYLVEQKHKGKWQPVMAWKKGMMGWTPAVFPKKPAAIRMQKSLRKKGIGIGITKEGKVKVALLPIRVIPVAYTVTGKVGSRTFDFKRKRRR